MVGAARGRRSCGHCTVRVCRCRWVLQLMGDESARPALRRPRPVLLNSKARLAIAAPSRTEDLVSTVSPMRERAWLRGPADTPAGALLDPQSSERGLFVRRESTAASANSWTVGDNGRLGAGAFHVKHIDVVRLPVGGALGSSPQMMWSARIGGQPPRPRRSDSAPGTTAGHST